MTKGKHGRRPVNKYMPYIRGAINTAKNVATAYAASKTFTNRKKESSGDGGVLTNQFDTKLLYKRKAKRPSRKARAAKKFKRKVQNVMANTAMPNLVHFVDDITVTTSAGYCQWMLFSLYGGYGQPGTGTITPYFKVRNDDFSRIIFNATNGLSSAANVKLFFNKAQLDLTLTSSTANTNQSTIIDVYCCISKNTYTANTANSALQIVSNLLNTSESNPASSPQMNQATPGMSLFQVAEFGKYFTIIEKRRFLLTPGQTATISMTQKPKYISNTINLVDLPNFQHGLAKHYFVQHWGITTQNPSSIDNAHYNPANSVIMQCNRYYNYKDLNGKAQGLTDAELLRYN
nr:MAG: capsid protein [Cressdnaviricota sp.]